jgi:hypothetical protein
VKESAGTLLTNIVVEGHDEINEAVEATEDHAGVEIVMMKLSC